MKEESTSWVRRASFSHTIYHRMDSAAMRSFPMEKLLPLPPHLRPKPRLESSLDNLRSESLTSQANQKFPAKKHRSLSPLPEIKLPDTFKEARNDRKRFATPTPQRKDHDKGTTYNIFNKEPLQNRVSDAITMTNTSPLKNFSAIKSSHKSKKSRKDSTWSKYFDYGGGRVTALDMADQWEVDMSKLYLGRKFAKGQYSQLYHGIYKDQPVAVKIIQQQTDDDENGVMGARLEKQFSREVTLLSHLDHRNVIKLVAAYKEPPVFCVITEYLSGGSLRGYLHKLNHKSLPLQKLVAIALEIARGMEYIHSHGVIHRDLKPENVIFDEDCHLKIVDFGIACGESYCDVLAEDPGTYRWMAPEMIKHKQYGRKVDVYSFGLVLWEMLAGAVPYENMTPYQAAFAVVNKNLRPIIPIDCPPSLRALVAQCWASKSEKRPEFCQIVKILEEFESSLAHDGPLNIVQNSIGQDHKKGLLYWIQKYNPVSPDRPCMPKPRLS